VFGLINVAVVAFREGSVEYEPEFTSPLYPWMQIFGAVTGGLLLTQMGTVALIGAAVITVGSVVWYFLYVRPRVSREGAATDAIRRQVGREALTDVESEIKRNPKEVLVALPKTDGDERERALIALAADLVRPDDGRVVAVRFQEVPDQVPLTDDMTAQSSADISFETRTEALAEDLGVEVEADEIVSHDTKHAIVNFAESRGVDAIVAEHEPLRLRSRLLGDPIDWMVRHAPCDVLLVDSSAPRLPEKVVVSSDTPPFPSAAVNVAGSIAAAHDGRVSLWYPADGGDGREESMEQYRTELSARLDVPADAEAIPTDERPPTADLLVRRGADHRLRGALTSATDQPFARVAGTTVTVYPREERRPSLIRRLLERYLL